jgi:HEAT repeat protein
VGPLYRSLQDQREDLRYHAATALERIGRRRALPRIVLTAKSLSVAQRLSTLGALHAVGRCPHVEDLLQTMAGDADPQIREAARAAMEAWTLLRAGARTEKEVQELLRGASGADSATSPDALVRESEAPAEPSMKRARSLRRSLKKH